MKKFVGWLLLTIVLFGIVIGGLYFFRWSSGLYSGKSQTKEISNKDGVTEYEVFIPEGDISWYDTGIWVNNHTEITVQNENNQIALTVEQQIFETQQINENKFGSKPQFAATVLTTSGKTEWLNQKRSCFTLEKEGKILILGGVEQIKAKISIRNYGDEVKERLNQCTISGIRYFIERYLPFIGGGVILICLIILAINLLMRKSATP